MAHEILEDIIMPRPNEIRHKHIDRFVHMIVLLVKLKEIRDFLPVFIDQNTFVLEPIGDQ